jgi:transposase
MVKTRSQTGNIAIKKEEEEYCKPNLGLGSATVTTRNKITKRKPSNNRTLTALQVKLEQDTDTKPLLQSTSKSSKLSKCQRISQEQINQFVHYIVNDNMSVAAAARKVKIPYNTVSKYYNVYRNDPEKKIPVPRNQHTHPRIHYTQEQIGNLIKYIDDDKMTIKEASAKANMAYRSGDYHYNRYLEDSNHAIPVRQLQQIYTQDQKNEFIDYVTNDKMNIAAASKKAKINTDTARGYYHKYFKVQNPNIATPSHIVTPRCFTQKQIKELISYIVDDKMSISAASRKANFNKASARKYYRQYLIDNNMEIPISKTNKRYTQDQINQLIGYIVDDKMSILAASKKANMSGNTAGKYYHLYLKDQQGDGLA